MASHSEIRVGSTDWVVRIDGADVPVKVMEKTKKASGRGYEFRLKRIDGSGRVFGRNIARGSGALRRPGEPVKGFGGGTPSKPPTRRAAPRKAPAKQAAAPKARPPSPPFSRNAPAAVSSLPSLRGRGRSAVRGSTSSPPARSAPARNRGEKVAEEGQKFRPKNDLVRKCMRALERLPSTAGSYEVRNTVAGVLAEHERGRYFTPLRR